MDPHNNLANVKKGRFLMFQTVHLECHHQRSFTLKMHQNRWRLGLRPRPHWGSLQCSPAPLAGLKGLLLRGGEGKGRNGRKKEERCGAGKGGERDLRPSQCWRQIDAPVSECWVPSLFLCFLCLFLLLLPLMANKVVCESVTKRVCAHD